MIIKLMELFNSTFSPEKILALAREFKAVQRLRNIHPANFCNALVGCSMGDEERSIATARRLYGQLVPRQIGFDLQSNSKRRFAEFSLP